MADIVPIPARNVTEAEVETGDFLFMLKNNKFRKTKASQFKGEKGDAAPYTKIQYSANGADWHNNYQDGDAYERQSTDNGLTWSVAIPLTRGDATTLQGKPPSSFFQIRGSFPEGFNLRDIDETHVGIWSWGGSGEPAGLPPFESGTEGVGLLLLYVIPINNGEDFVKYAEAINYWGEKWSKTWDVPSDFYQREWSLIARSVNV